jgi:hypothetical protein
LAEQAPFLPPTANYRMQKRLDIQTKTLRRFDPNAEAFFKFAAANYFFAAAFPKFAVKSSGSFSQKKKSRFENSLHKFHQYVSR